MKLKNILAIALCASAFTACETVDEDERFIGPVEFTPKKNILIEDFTGQKCLNCPNATNAVHSLQATYGEDHVIAVAIHGGPMSFPSTTPVGLANDESQEYNSKWGIDTWPKGMVNRKNGLLEFSSWSAKAIDELQQMPGADILATSTFNAEDGKLNLNVEVTGKQTSAANLQVWLIENNIVKIQFMPDGSVNPQYVHNHVFRSSVNGTWGEDIDLVDGEKITKTYEYQINPASGWVADNMEIVTFVTSKENGVLQVIKTPVVK